MKRTLVAYATKHGSTRDVAEAVADVLAADVEPADAIRSLDGYDCVVLGGSLYTGRWHRDARRFLERHHAELAHRRLHVFALGPKTLAPEEVASAGAQLGRALVALDVDPASTAIFGGVIDPDKLRFPFSRLPASDARDWDAIRGWAESIRDRDTAADDAAQTVLTA